MIIQCPSCNTKFALDETSIEEIEDPRFHCSRCDHVFSLEESTQRITPPDFAPKKATKGIVETESPIVAKQPSVKSLSIPEDLTYQASLEAPHESSSFKEEESDFLEDEDSSQLPLRFNEELPENSVDDTLELDPTHTLELDPLALEKGIKKQSEPPRFPEPVASSQAEEEKPAPSTISAQAFTAPKPKVEEPRPLFGTQSSPGATASMGYTPRSSASRSSLTPLPLQSSSPASSSLGSPVLASTGPAVGGAPTDYTPSHYAALQKNGAWRGFILLASPVVAFLTFLVASGIYLRFDTRTASSLSEILFPSIPKLPPPEMYLKSTKLKTVTLEGGERVVVVSGRLANDSPQEYSDVIVEAVLFEAGGSPIMRTKAKTSSSLAKGKIKSLTPEVIEEAQTAGTPSGFSIPSGSHTEFVVVMNNGQTFPEMKTAKYFSARIYSVLE